MPDTAATWLDALNRHSYPFDLTRYSGAENYAPWFSCRSEKGDRAQTIRFEDCFRAHARTALEPWFEVVFWKMYSQEGRRDRATTAVISKVESGSTSAAVLWSICAEYVGNPTKEGLRKLLQRLIASSAIAIASTFPAFICPERFPMIDTQIAKWVMGVARDADWLPGAGHDWLRRPRTGEPRRRS